MDLNSAVVVVTGAGRGLGAALAISLADQGCKLILCGRNPEALAQVSAAIEARTGSPADQVVVDLASSDSVKAALAEIHVRHPQVDILINNGAMWLEASEQPHSAAEVTGVIDAALSGTFLLTQGLLPVLKASKRPDIVTIGSISGLPNAPLHSVSLPSMRPSTGNWPWPMACGKCSRARRCVRCAYTRRTWKMSRRWMRPGSRFRRGRRASRAPTVMWWRR